ncbi:histidine kinase [uncultured Psychroserpens sp.]|uniref:sensor histidine kinase n=1 Tax=uncultured Psychroserpens sp. TaxID=255436 RepID=UPI00260FBEB0|nr:histidine kinase [uncultured Psychroserpens sp.]
MKRTLEIVLNIIFWAICGYAILTIFVPQSIDVDIVNDKEIVKNIYGYDKFENRILITNILSILITIIFYYFNVYFLSRYFFKQQHKKYIKFLVLYIGIVFLIKLIINVLFFGSEFLAVKSLIISLLILLFFAGISFVHIIILRWQKEEALKQKLKEDKLTAELQLLKSQINPHFLFNALNNLLSIAEKHKQTEVSSGIAQLSELLRFLLHDTSDETILLSKEIEFIEHYIQLNKLRFDTNDPISIAFKKEGDLSNIHIAPALLIPFVENAFKHGIDIYNKSFIDINLTASNNTIHFVCRNSLKETSNTDTMLAKNSGIGLQNVKRRLDILYPNKHDLNISITDNTYIVDLKLAYD